MRTCTKCGLEKDEEEFSWSIRGVKKHSRCNSCRAEDRMDYYETHRDQELEYKASRQIEKRDEARIFIVAYLATHPCVDCGENDLMVLTFDHVRGTKKMDISQMVNQGYSLEAIAEEIDKCDVPCANCHMRVEKQRRGTRYS
jgi:hypothetical protein